MLKAPVPLIVPNALAALASIETNRLAIARVKQSGRELGEACACRAAGRIVGRRLCPFDLFLVRHLTLPPRGSKSGPQHWLPATALGQF
jgi:hypothetical protein